MNSRTEVHVCDSSALLAYLFGEPGAETVLTLLSQSAVSAVNWSEVRQKSAARRADTGALRGDLEALGLMIVPFGAADAEAAARLWPTTRTLGLSLADRACLALALTLEAPVWTADRAWQGLLIPDLTVRLVR